jgi:DNA-directed RNA polymerase II subunit RPB3
VVIVKLGRNQEIKLRAIARKGIGKDHAKWIPVATAVFQYVADISINQGLMDELTGGGCCTCMSYGLLP